MKKFVFLLVAALLLGMLCSCHQEGSAPQIAATTLPVYEFTHRICQNTDLTVGRLVTESISCLHDYSLQVSQMRMIEGADTLVISGVGLEDFLGEAISSAHNVIDASEGITPLCPEDSHNHEDHQDHGHSHEQDPHIWLSPSNAKIMARNICIQLSGLYPEHTETFQQNLTGLYSDLDTLHEYGKQTLSNLTQNKLITFHDGFAYFADCFGLTILHAMEEESGREASAQELKDLIGLIQDHRLKAVFIETNGSISAADVIAAETHCVVYPLDMAMSGDSYFDSMYHNIDTIKEALG